MMIWGLQMSKLFHSEQKYSTFWAWDFFPRTSNDCFVGCCRHEKSKLRDRYTFAWAWWLCFAPWRRKLCLPIKLKEGEGPLSSSRVTWWHLGSFFPLQVSFQRIVRKLLELQLSLWYLRGHQSQYLLSEPAGRGSQTQMTFRARGWGEGGGWATCMCTHTQTHTEEDACKQFSF